MSAPGGTGGYAPPAPVWWVPPPLPYGIGAGGGAALPRLHPMTAVDILDGAFGLLKANAAKLLVVVAVFAVPVQMVSAYLSRDLFAGRSLIGVFGNPSFMQSTAGTGGPGVGARLLLTLLGWLGVAVAGGAISHVVGASFVGRDETAGAGLRVAASRGLALIGAAIVVHLAELAGTAALLVPGLLATAASVAVSPAIVIEGIGGMAGVRRSWRLLSPRLWPTAGALLLTGVVASVLGYAVGLLPFIVVAVVGLGHWGWVLMGVGNVLSVFVSWTLAGSVATLFYFDARIRQEGLDLQLLAAGLEAA